jgi:hypothetical protein
MIHAFIEATKEPPKNRHKAGEHTESFREVKKDINIVMSKIFTPEKSLDLYVIDNHIYVNVVRSLSTLTKQA